MAKPIVESPDELNAKAMDAILTATVHQTKESWAFARRAAQAFKKAWPLDPQAAFLHQAACTGYKLVTK